MRNITLSFLVLASSLLFACGGENEGSIPIPAAQNAQTNDPKSSEAESPAKPAPSAEACNSIANDAQPISAIGVVAIDAPAPAGGTIPIGTFHLHGITLYAGKSGKSTAIPITLRGTVKVTGDTVEQVLDGKRPDGTTVAERSTESFATNGSEVTFTKTCDGTGSRTGTFTATSSELTLFLVNDVGQTVAYEYR